MLVNHLHLLICIVLHVYSCSGPEPQSNSSSAILSIQNLFLARALVSAVLITIFFFSLSEKQSINSNNIYLCSKINVKETSFPSLWLSCLFPQKKGLPRSCSITQTCNSNLDKNSLPSLSVLGLRLLALNSSKFSARLSNIKQNVSTSQVFYTKKPLPFFSFFLTAVLLALDYLTLLSLLSSLNANLVLMLMQGLTDLASTFSIFYFACVYLYLSCHRNLKFVFHLEIQNS